MGEASVETAVRLTEKATLPFDKYVMTFDAVPPGHAPSSTMPAASMGSKPKSIEIIKPSRGIKMNCAAVPITISSGFVRIRLKSWVVSVVPMPNIMTPSRGVIRLR